jgi:hypothetical protein
MFKPFKSSKIKSDPGQSFEHFVRDCYSKAA